VMKLKYFHYPLTLKKLIHAVIGIMNLYISFGIFREG
jgi:hypothetical protein